MITMTRRALVLDDDPAVAELLGGIVRMAGLEADVVTDSETLLDRLTADHELIVLDLAMGNADGITVMSSLQVHAPQSAVLLVSGVGAAVLESARRVAEMLSLHVVGVFSKPVSLIALREAIEEWAALAPREAVDFVTDRVIDADEVLDGRGLSLAYQPKVEIATGRIIGAEALLRWTDTNGSTVPAIEVVSAVEAAGLSTDLLRVVASRAAADRRRFPALAQLDDVSINMSCQDLLEADLPEILCEILSGAAAPERWTLELTETSPLFGVTSSLSVLTRFRLRGFGLAIDDFGAGSSNFERLLDMPFTELKIDRLLTALLHTGDPCDEMLVRSTIEFGHAHGVQVVAEGVETAGQFARLLALGCDIGQGYLLARPMQPNDLQLGIAHVDDSGAG